MIRILLFAVLFLSCSMLLAEDHTWPLDSLDSSEFSAHGEVTAAAGVEANSVVFDGSSLLKIKHSEQLAGGQAGFTLTVWVNPYRLNGDQQMIAAKNRYSLGERQWSLMIDKDNRFRLYVYQGKWETVGCDTLPKAGHWHLIGVVVRPGSAELWENGKMAGKVELTKPVPLTKAPLTLGGVDDNGRVRQTFVGALDEFRLFDKPLDARKMAVSYKPVTATHKIPEPPQPLTLWTGQTIPKASEAEVLKHVRFHVLKKQRPDTDGCRWTLGVGLAWHKGSLYASYGFNKGHENTATEEAHVRVSNDGGRNWGPPVVMDAGKGDLGVSHGVFLSHQDKLWAFMGAFYAHTRLYHRVHTRAYTLNETSGHWEPRGAVLEGGFWPMQEPLRMSDGNWIMSGFRIGGQFGQPGNVPAVAISRGDDFTKWKMVIIRPSPGLGKIWGESTVIVEGKRILNISRYGARAVALLSVSEDHGRTWTPAAPSNLPMATSKPYAGILSTGQRFLVCTTTADTGGRRSPLTIAVSKPGESAFRKIFVIRHSVFPQGPGVSDPKADFSYPYAVEREGKLYIGYTHKSHAANELAVIPVESLEVK